MSTENDRGVRERRREARRTLRYCAQIHFVLTDNGSVYLTRNATIENASANGAMMRLKGVQPDDLSLIATSSGKCTMAFNPPMLCGVSFLAGQVAWIRSSQTETTNETRCGVCLSDTVLSERECLARFIAGMPLVCREGPPSGCEP
jgi:hypothetical protein